MKINSEESFSRKVDLLSTSAKTVISVMQYEKCCEDVNYASSEYKQPIETNTQ